VPATRGPRLRARSTAYIARSAARRAASPPRSAASPSAGGSSAANSSPSSRGDDVAGPQAPAQHAGHVAQQRVAGVMPVWVVDPLGAVEVEQRSNGRVLAVAAAAPGLLLERVLERAGVAEGR
jgi:hypothetical protein